MLSTRASRAKSLIKARAPIVASAFNGIRRLSGFDGARGRRRLNDFIRQQTGSRVVLGPFAGMSLVEGASWGDGDVSPKLLGTYEQELHEALSKLSGRRYDAAVDLGCAEGYYAVGLALLYPDIPIFAFDTDTSAIDIARAAAKANGVEQRIVFGGFCDWPHLRDLATRLPRLLIISDCEGYEVELFGRGDRRVLARSDMIIECHDDKRPNSTDEMTEQLSSTHSVRRLDTIGRNPNQFRFLTEMHETYRWQAISENRPYCSHWLFCESRE